MSKVKFVSVEFIKDNSTIEDNVDNKKLVPFIYKVQDLYLQQILGTTFYNHLKDAVVNSTLTSDEENLLRDYIQPMIVEYVVYQSLPFLSNKITNKSISQENSEFSQPSGLDEIKFLRNSVRDMAEFYGKRLAKFLCDNSILFPSYNNPDDNENLRKSSKSYFTGVYIPKSRIGGIRSVNDLSDDCEDC